MQTQSLAINSPTASFIGQPMVSRRGKVTGHSFVFGGEAKSFRDLKAKLKAAYPACSARELSKLANEIVKGETDMRQQVASAFVTGLAQSGFVIDSSKVRKATAEVRFIKVKAPKVEKADPAKIADSFATMSSADKKQLLIELQASL